MTDNEIILANIERLLKAKGVSADKLSKSAGAEDAIRNLRRYVSGEKTGTWKINTLRTVATALGTTPWELLRPVGAMPNDEDFRDEDFRDLAREVAREVIAEEFASAQPAKRRTKNNR